MSFWSTFPWTDSGVLTVGLHKGKESSEVSVTLSCNDTDQIEENTVGSCGYAANRVFLRAKKLEGKGQRRWRKILGMAKHVKGGYDICWHISSEFLWQMTLDSHTGAVVNLIILCTWLWPARES